MSVALKRWLHAQLFSEHREGSVVRFSLRHLSAMKQGLGDVDAVDVPEDRETLPSFVDDCAAQLETSATQDAEGLAGGVQSYAVVAHYSEAPDAPGRRFTMRVASSPDADDGSEDPSRTETPDKSGIVAQSMRHSEALMKMATAGAQQTIQALTRQLAIKDETIAKLSEKHLESIELIEDLSSSKHERDLRLLRETNTQKRQDDLVNMVTPLVPVMLAKLTGQKVLPGGAGDGVRALLTSITEDQFGSLMQVLRPEQQALVANMMREMQEADEKRKEAN